MHSLRKLILSSLAALVISLALAKTDDSVSTGYSGYCPVNENIFISVFRTPNGEWVTPYADQNKFTNLTREVKIDDINMYVLECGNSRYIAVSNFLKETRAEKIDASVEADETPSQPLSDENHKTAAHKTDGGAKECDKKDNEIISSYLSINKTLDRIVKETMEAMAENRIMKERLKSITETLKQVKEMLKTLEDLKHVEVKLEGNVSHSVNATTEVPMQFHPKFKGMKVKLSSDFRTATRTKPRQVFGDYAGVVSSRQLRDDEIFKIRIDENIPMFTKLGIGFGVIQDPTAGIKNTDHIYQSLNGTWAISNYHSSPGTSDIYINATTISMDSYLLDTSQLYVGTTVGLSRKENGDLHFYLNGEDKGAAFKGIPKNTHAFVDIRNYVTKITIVD